MNKFLNRKKPEQAIGTATPLVTDLTRPTTPASTSPGLKKSQSKWKKGKKAPEPKPHFDLNGALPSIDDFRTSLIMPNLSARFSMLREQDDPTSLLGKASDDSVLQPRRRSRMLDFGAYSSRGGLGDIAEVASIRSTTTDFRPPFANHGRVESGVYEDGYSSDTGASVVSRARPGEGNVMFGGRQKVYMIHKSGSARNLGKAVYEDDIRQSAFQKHRQREREAAAAKMADEASQFDFGLSQRDAEEQDDHAQQDENGQDLSNSPSLFSYDKKRSTNSSSVRSEARSSTAATSVASQPLASGVAPAAAAPLGSMQSRPSLERASTKGRRLYEPGLDQHIYEQQNSALTRLNSIQRQRGQSNAGGRAASPYLHQTKSASNLQEHPSQRSVYTTAGTISPPPDRRPAPLTTIGPHVSGFLNGSPSTSGAGSPLSPHNPLFDEAAVLQQALEPADRGKATAMGAFNKPKQPFDEKQYLERQLALQRSTSSATVKPEPTPFQQRIGQFEERANENDQSKAPPKLKSNESRQPYQGSAARNPNRSITPSQLEQFTPHLNAHYSDAHSTFFGNIAASDSEDDEDDRKADHHYTNSYFAGKWQPTALPPVSEHPALRSQRSNPLMEEDEEDSTGDHSADHSAVEFVDAPSAVPESVISENGKKDSVTLGENLSGMISHLRTKSNASSMYPGDDVPLSDDIPEMPTNSRNLHAYGANNPLLRGGLDDSRISSMNSGLSPWDLEDPSKDRSVSPLEPDSSAYGSRIPKRSAAQRDQQGQSQASQVSGISQESDPGSWQNELRRQEHQRDASSATQQERAAFDNELAARRAAILDNIKSMVETERSNSPQIGGGGFKALNMLRTRSSRDSFDPKRDAKSIRTAASSAAPSPVLANGERGGYSLDMPRTRADSPSRPPLPSNSSVVRNLHSEQDLRRDWVNGEQNGNRSLASSGISQDSRSRSNSAATGRSRSHSRPYRDDLEKAMAEGSGSSAAGLPDLTSFIPKELTPRASPEVLSGQFEGGRARSGSRNGYFDAKQYQTTHPANRNVTSPVLQTLTSAVYDPRANSTRASPAVTPLSEQAATPPASNDNHPLNGSVSSSGQPVNGARPLRKKTISKSDISEPTLLTWTSNIDTIDLPPGASLKNGMVEAPPVPPINPKRKTRKIFGKSVDRRESLDDQLDGRNGHARTPDAWTSFDSANGAAEHNYNHSVSSQGLGLDGQSANSYAYQPNGIHPAERLERPTTSGASLSGAMF